MQDTTYRKQYALIDTRLQTLLFEGSRKFSDFFPNQKALSCMTTFEITYPYPYVLTVLDSKLDLDTEDIPLFQEQYRRQFDMYIGVWLIITTSSAQYDFIRSCLPVGHGIYVILMQTDASYEEINEKGLEFIQRFKDSNGPSMTRIIKSTFFFDDVACSRCGSRQRIVSKIRLFRNNETKYCSEDTPLQYVDVPATDFSYVLQRYANLEVETNLEDGKYHCSMCNSPIVAMQETSDQRYKEIMLFITADDCLRYLIPELKDI